MLRSAFEVYDQKYPYNRREPWIRLQFIGTSLGANWEKGKHVIGESRNRGFGEVYLALDRTSNDYVAVKKVKIEVDESRVRNESRMLKECGSKFVVRYYDLVKVWNELWVRLSWSG